MKLPTHRFTCRFHSPENFRRLRGAANTISHNENNFVETKCIAVLPSETLLFISLSSAVLKHTAIAYAHCTASSHHNFCLKNSISKQIRKLTRGQSICFPLSLYFSTVLLFYIHLFLSRYSYTDYYHHATHYLCFIYEEKNFNLLRCDLLLFCL